MNDNKNISDQALKLITTKINYCDYNVTKLFVLSTSCVHCPLLAALSTHLLTYFHYANFKNQLLILLFSQSPDIIV